jgi:hypothetical protein
VWKTYINCAGNVYKLIFIQDDHWNENVGEWASCTADGDVVWAMYETNGICMRDETDEGVLWWMRVCFLR